MPKFFPVLPLLYLPATEIPLDPMHSQLMSPLHLTVRHSVKAPTTSMLLAQWPVVIPHNPKELSTQPLLPCRDTVCPVFLLYSLLWVFLLAVLHHHRPLWGLHNFSTANCRSNSELNV